MLLQWHPTAAAAKLLQSCPTLCDPIDGSPPGSPVPGILQARTLEWSAISFSILILRKALKPLRCLFLVPGSKLLLRCVLDYRYPSPTTCILTSPVTTLKQSSVLSQSLSPTL